MDKISQLPDELLLKVLLPLPTKVAANTSILSKRWEFLWMWLPKLEYDHSMDERKSLIDFITLNMPQHRAPVIESLRLNFSYGYKGSVTREDIRMWVAIAVTRFLRELSLDLYPNFESQTTKLPSSLYTCKSLVILKPEEGILVDVPHQKSLHRLLSSCPVLEDLFVKHNGCESEHLETFSVIVPSLQRLTLKICRGSFFQALVMNTPSLKYFKFTDYTCEHDDFSDIDFDFDYNGYSFYSDDMPKLEVDSTYLDTENFVSLITYVKRLSLCLPDQAEKALYREGIVLSQLRHLKLCSCTIKWSKLLVLFLKDSPNLQELVVHLTIDHTDICEDPPVCWENQLNCVPGCLLSSLGTFKWIGIYGSQKELDLVKFVLRNACCLKTATILFRSWDSALEEDELEMVMQDLSLSSRGSKDVKLVFVLSI
uniref:FBD domain-containing protein n=1 Tax=Brassica oleracea TaxID=3712 RepID=A0A3P6FTM7_BRAOL|nr:unnamed protein product [Brassica oleracea]